MTAPIQHPISGEGVADALGCPWCASDDLALDWADTNCRFLRCNECGCTGPNSAADATARILWNDRVLPSQEVVEAIVGRLRQYIDDLRYPPSADSAERRIAAAQQAIKQTLALRSAATAARQQGESRHD